MKKQRQFKQYVKEDYQKNKKNKRACTKSI